MNKINVNYLGLAASIMNSNLQKEIIIVGMTTLGGEHGAESLKVGIEKILNKFTFDNSKIHGKYKFKWILNFNQDF